MLQNNNSSVIKHLSKSSLSSNKFRNLLIGLVIALSAFLLSFSSTFAYNAAIDIQDKTMYQGTYEGVSEEILENIKNNYDVVKYGVFQEVGTVKSDKNTLTIIYADDNLLKLSNIEISAGAMPNKENEIVIEENYSLPEGEKADIGDFITLSMRNNISREVLDKKFIICGFLNNGNSRSNTRFSAIVAKEFVLSDGALSTDNSSIAIQVANASQYSNEQLKEKVKEIGLLAGVEEKYIYINDLNIDSNNASYETIFFIVAIAFIVLFACALVIYNIFHISIMQRIFEYGQLRTIGTTPRQLRKIVFREARILSIRYIPLGIILGCLASIIISPVKWQMLPSSICIMISAVITYLTVLLSVRKPAKYAALVSPMDAVRHTDYRYENKKSRQSTRKLSAFSLGLINLTRNKKKAIITFTSLTLSGILFIGSASIMNAVDSDEYASHFFPYDSEYKISLNGDLLSSTFGYSSMQMDNPLTANLRKEILQMEGVDGVETSKYISCRILEEKYGEETIEISNMLDRDIIDFQKYVIEGNLTGNTVSDEIGIVVNKGTYSYQEYHMSYEIGDRINAVIGDGKSPINITFRVCGIIDNNDDGTTLYLSSDVMDKIIPYNCNLAFYVISNQGYSQQVSTQLKKLIKEDERLAMTLLEDTTTELKSAFHLIAVALYAFVTFIGIFAIINLLNTIITNTIARKKEIGILQAVGLDRKKLRIMIQSENICLILGSFSISLMLGGFGGYALCNKISNIGGLNYIGYQFPLWQIILYFVLLVTVQLTITYFLDRSMSKKSVIERLQ